MQQLPKFIPHPRIAPRRSVYNADMAEFAAIKGLRPDDPTLSYLPDAPWETYYAHDYTAIFKQMAAAPADQREQFSKSVIRELVKTDLFFIVFFITDATPGNVPFVVKACNDIENSTPDGGLSLTKEFHNYARGHFKTAIISIALTVKRIVNDPECCTLVFSFKKPAGEAIVGSVRNTLEKEIMVQCFPDILYDKPDTESPSWSLQNGIRVKRTSVSRKEHTMSASGLIEGMLTGGHYDHRIYDDVETWDIAKSPDQMNMCFDGFEMSRNLASKGGTELIIGTYYSHLGPLVRIRDKKNINGESMYRTVIKPATHDGTRNGRPVFLSQEELDELKVDRSFNSQQLCNPTPSDVVKLDSRMLKNIDPHFLPKERYKFLIIDQAGGKDTQAKGNRKGDMWSIGLISVRPYLDDLGASDCYLEAFEADQMTHAEAIDTIIRMYLDGGFIRAVGVEKVGLSTTEIHIRDALKVQGRRISEETKTLILLRPGGRSTEERVEAALQWPLVNGKLYLSTDISEEKRQKLISEMDLFPYYHPDIINMWAYVYDIIKTYRFTAGGEKPKLSVTQMMAARRIR